MRNFFYCVFLLSALIIIPVLAHAHNTGASFERVVGNYKVDVGYDPDEFQAKAQNRFDFAISDPNTEEEKQFSDVWVRVVQGNNTIFAGGIQKALLGRTGMVFTFPSAGDYDLDVRFEDKDQTIVETSFPIKVVAEAKSDSIRPPRNMLWVFGFLIGILGFVLGLVGTKIFRKRPE